MRRDDFDDYAANLADPIAAEHLGGVSDRRTAWRTFGAGQGFWLLQGAGWWGIELKGTGKLVGTVGAFIRETSPEEIELGWTLYRAYWRNGYATEAAAAALAFALDRHKTNRVIAHINAANTASIRVSEKIGMKYDGEVPFYDVVCSRYVYPRSPFTAAL
jgi:RimJ/RimL family protein N-acetyltransferase